MTLVIAMGRPQLDSFASGMMLGTVLYRNQNGLFNKLTAQLSFALIPVVAAVEACCALALAGLALALYPLSDQPLQRSVQWFGSCLFCVGWALCDFFANLVVDKLVADEASARQMVRQGSLLTIPRGAVV